MKKTIKPMGLLMALALTLSMILSGCKDKSEGVKETSNEQTTTTPTATPEPSKEAESEKEVEAPVEEGYRMHSGEVEVQQADIFADNFESGETKFIGRGSAKVEIVADKGGEGSNSLYVSERTATWNGAMIDVDNVMKASTIYVMSAMLYYEEGPDSIQIDCKFERNGNSYHDFASAIVKKGEWTEITGDMVTPNLMNTPFVYFETSYSGSDIINFYIDDFKLSSELVTAARGDIPSLKEVYKDYFTMGMAATTSEISPERQELIKEQFNSFTAGNEMKPDSLLDYETCISDPKYDDNPAVTLKRAKELLDFAQEAGIPVRGHTLVWHAQTPRWFFAEGYSNHADAPLVSKELMLKRMENYIKNVLELIQAEYPGVVYAWDVVNEAVNEGDGDPDGYRVKDSLWYQVIGPEFVEKAFEYARKYADPGVKLFYNDYNTEYKARVKAISNLAKKLQEKGLIDGIGLQTHISIDSPSLIDIELSIREYGLLGLELHITELDMGMTEATEEAYIKQAQRYKRFFTLIRNLCDTDAANISNVTFWGLSDDITWLSKPGQPSYPLLFDKYLIQKPAFWGVVLSPDIALY